MICADRVHPSQIDQDLVTRMRASVLLLGALLARCGEANLPMPGGDAIGLRSIDLHVAGLRAMGASIDVAGGIIRAAAHSGLRGTEVILPQPSVGATENLLLAAVLATGTTVIRNAAREPEIADLAQCLTTMGARISGIQSDTLTVEGGRDLFGAVYPVMPDRIEMGTIACAAAITNGEVLLRHGRLDLLGAAAPALSEAGVELRQTADGVIARRSPAGLVGIDLQTRPIPDLPLICKRQSWPCCQRQSGRASLRKRSSSIAFGTSMNYENWARTSRFSAGPHWCAACPNFAGLR